MLAASHEDEPSIKTEIARLVTPQGLTLSHGYRDFEQMYGPPAGQLPPYEIYVFSNGLAVRPGWIIGVVNAEACIGDGTISKKEEPPMGPVTARRLTAGREGSVKEAWVRRETKDFTPEDPVYLLVQFAFQELKRNLNGVQTRADFGLEQGKPILIQQPQWFQAGRSTHTVVYHLPPDPNRVLGAWTARIYILDHLITTYEFRVVQKAAQ